MISSKNKKQKSATVKSLELRIEQIENQLEVIQRRLDPIAKTDRMLRAEGR